MYYLFIHKKKDIENYKAELNRVDEARNKGITPVYSEKRNAKTVLIESMPYNFINGLFVVGGTWLLTRLHINELVSVAIVLVINNFCGACANYVFTMIKHGLRLKLCKRLGIQATEANIASMESLEYQSV